MQNQVDTPAPVAVYRALVQLQTNNNTNSSSNGNKRRKTNHNNKDEHYIAIPSYQLYKVAREQQLITFRGIVRVLAMHYGKTLPKHAHRLLQDFAQQLCIPSQRVAMQVQMATNDSFIHQLITSQVLTRRYDYFDGVQDVPIANINQRVAVQDDGNVIGINSSKQSILRSNAAHVHDNDEITSRSSVTTLTNNTKTSSVAHVASQNTNSFTHDVDSEQSNAMVSGLTGATNANNVTHVSNNVGNKRKRATSAIFQANVTKIGRQIEQTAQQYLFATDARLQSTLRKTLQLKRDALLQLRDEMTETIVQTLSQQQQQ